MNLRYFSIINKVIFLLVLFLELSTYSSEQQVQISQHKLEAMNTSSVISGGNLSAMRIEIN